MRGFNTALRSQVVGLIGLFFERLAESSGVSFRGNTPPVKKRRASALNACLESGVETPHSKNARLTGSHGTRFLGDTPPVEKRRASALNACLESGVETPHSKKGPLVFCPILENAASFTLELS